MGRLGPSVVREALLEVREIAGHQDRPFLAVMDLPFLVAADREDL